MYPSSDIFVKFFIRKLGVPRFHPDFARRFAASVTSLSVFYNHVITKYPTDIEYFRHNTRIFWHPESWADIRPSVPDSRRKNNASVMLVRSSNVFFSNSCGRNSSSS
jgi:hypothetical protein